jgi:hypothetical protein
VEALVFITAGNHQSLRPVAPLLYQEEDAAIQEERDDPVLIVCLND